MTQSEEIATQKDKQGVSSSPKPANNIKYCVTITSVLLGKIDQFQLKVCCPPVIILRLSLIITYLHHFK